MRMTRATIRAQAQDDSEPDAITVHEDKDADTLQEQDLQQEDDTSRPALKDITDDNSTTADEVGELKQSTRGKKAKGSKKKGRQGKKDNYEPEADMVEEVAAQAPTHNSPSEQQPELREEVEALETLAPAEPTPELAAEDDNIMAHTPEKTPAITLKTPKFDAEVHALAVEPFPTQDGQEDSFVGSIKTRSPTKLSREPSHDSFIESIKSRTPARRQLCIEDSVEAMDALEDAIEEISTKLPQIEHLEIESPVKTRKQSPPKTLPPSARKTALDTKVAAKTQKSGRTSPIKTKTKTKPSHIKPAPLRTDSGRMSTVKPTKAPTISKSKSRPTMVMPKATATTEPPKPTVSFSNSPLKTQPNLAKKRINSGPLSTSKPAFVPAKSSKPPTTSTFALPGEAVAAKLKAQREDRAKKEDDGKKTFKARPAPSTTGRPSVAPRENKASLARKSNAPMAKAEGDNKENVAPKPTPRSRSSVAAGSSSKAGGPLDVKKTRPDSTVNGIRANSSVRRTTSFPPPTNGSTAVKKASTAATTPSTAPKPVSNQSVVPRVASLTKQAKPTPIPTPVAGTPQKVKGKEVYGRTKLEQGRMEKEKREKEEAAKKARADAAERGRLASREWAERQKQKLAREKAAAAANAAAPTDTTNPEPASVALTGS